jgi:hypothetical protein
MFDFSERTGYPTELDPITCTQADSFATEPTNIVNRINSLNASSGSNIIVMIGTQSLSISASLRNALKTIGLSSNVTLASEKYRHLLFGKTHLPVNNGAKEYLDNIPATFYPKGYGYTAPIKSGFWNYAIENITANTPWVATIKKYRADCSESTENRNMSLASSSKQYDGYAGLSTHKYIYATPYIVSLKLSGINSRTHSKTFYYYTIEGTGESYYNEYNHWWDKKVPKNIMTTEIVEREYIGKVNPTDKDKRVGYTFREWLNNGSSREVVDYYDYYLRWFEITYDNATLTIPITDVKGELLDQYTISGTEKYRWYDGSILSVNRVNTFADLKNMFGMTITIEVTYSSTPNGTYYIHRAITFTGLNANAGLSNVFSKTWSTTATYTEESDSPDGAAASATTGTRAVKWG